MLRTSYWDADREELLWSDTHEPVIKIGTRQDNFNSYIMIRKAAWFIGVTPNTLRNWEKKGALKTYRHPINKSRLYKKSDLEELLASIKPI
jgi:MerR family copper efflux transcriptional regulator